MQIDSGATPAPHAANPKWEHMGAAGKMVFIGKLVIFICSFGFVFPLLLAD